MTDISEVVKFSPVSFCVFWLVCQFVSRITQKVRISTKLGWRIGLDPEQNPFTPFTPGADPDKGTDPGPLQDKDIL